MWRCYFFIYILCSLLQPEQLSYTVTFSYTVTQGGNTRLLSPLFHPSNMWHMITISDDPSDPDQCHRDITKQPTVMLWASQKEIRMLSPSAATVSKRMIDSEPKQTTEDNQHILGPRRAFELDVIKLFPCVPTRMEQTDRKNHGYPKWTWGEKKKRKKKKKNNSRLTSRVQ